MMRSIAYILSLSLISGYASDLLAAPNSDTGIWVEICGSGKLIRLDLGDEEKPPLQPFHSKACHAICCQNEEEADDKNENNDIV